MSVSVRKVTSLSDCDTARSIAATVWGADAACSTPQMSVHAKYGGVVLLADVDDRSVGFLFSFPALYRGEWVLWSHETAVLPEHLHHGIGTLLKQTQRQAARELGYAKIAWTYDPLVSRNAHFNLNKLGAEVVEYKVNAYGADDGDLVNQGIETDRFIAVWDVDEITDTRAVEKRVSRDRQSDPPGRNDRAMPADGASFLHGSSDLRVVLDLAPDGNPAAIAQQWSGQHPKVSTRIPLDSPPTHAQKVAWRHAFREAAQDLFSYGMKPVEFRRENGYGEYIWAHSAALR